MRQEEQRGLDLLLGHFIGENRAVPTICLFPVSLCQIWSSCRIGLCGKLRSQMSPEPAQEHFQKWNLSLLVQGCAWAAWQVCSEPGHLQEALSLLRLALRMLCSASRQEGQQGLSLVCRDITPSMARCRPVGRASLVAKQQKLLPAHLIFDLLCRSGRFAAQMWDLSAEPLLSLTLYLRRGTVLRARLWGHRICAWWVGTGCLCFSRILHPGAVLRSSITPDISW